MPVARRHQKQNWLEAGGVVAVVASVAQEDPLRLLTAAAAAAVPVVLFCTRGKHFISILPHPNLPYGSRRYNYVYRLFCTFVV